MSGSASSPVQVKFPICMHIACGVIVLYGVSNLVFLFLPPLWDSPTLRAWQAAEPWWKSVAHLRQARIGILELIGAIALWRRKRWGLLLAAAAVVWDAQVGFFGLAFDVGGGSYTLGSCILSLVSFGVTHFTLLVVLNLRRCREAVGVYVPIWMLPFMEIPGSGPSITKYAYALHSEARHMWGSGTVALLAKRRPHTRPE